MSESSTGGVAFALSGLGGNNAHGAGFLAAAQEIAGTGHPTYYPGLKMITCTSGTIAGVAKFLQRGDLRAMVQDGIDAVDRATWLPREQWADPARLALITGWTGLPGIFGPYIQAVGERVLAEAMATASGAWPPLPPTPQEWVNTIAPARMFVPEIPQSRFEEWATALNQDRVGIAFNSFDPSAGEEYLYVNDLGMELIRQHHDRHARHGSSRKHSTYKPIDASAVKNALWLFWYGFDQPGQHVDGAYARSIILNEATFADTIYAVKPVNHRWIGPLPQNAYEVLDMQTELWMGTSYRQQRYQIDLINRLLDEGRLLSPGQAANPAPPAAGQAGNGPPAHGKNLKEYHHVEFVPVEIQVQRGFFTYFVEDINVFDDALQQGRKVLQVPSRPSGNAGNSTRGGSGTGPRSPRPGVTSRPPHSAAGSSRESTAGTVHPAKPVQGTPPNGAAPSGAAPSLDSAG